MDERQHDELVEQLAAAQDMLERLIAEPATAKRSLAIVLLERARWRAEQAVAEFEHTATDE